MVSLHAIKAAGALAKGLRESFLLMAKELVPLIIARFKEKRLIEDAHTSLDGCMICV